jgi:4-hydroxy-tetrahydrodipicolinate synthase
MKGLWTSPLYTFTEEGKLDERGIRSNVERLIDTKVNGIGFGFSEPTYVTIEERKRGMEIFVDAVGGRIPFYLHTTDNSVAETVSLTRHAQSLGAKAVMIWVPLEFGKSEEMALDFMKYVAAEVDIAIIAYNTYHSGFAFGMDAILEIAEIENVCAFKNAVNDFSLTVEIARRAGDKMVVSDPFEDHLPAAIQIINQQLLLGTTSVYLMQSPSYQPIREYMKLAQDGRYAEAWMKYYELDKIRTVWNDMYRVLFNKTAALHPIATTKYWMDLVGMAGGPVPPPMRPLGEADKADFKRRLQATGWLEKLYPGNLLAAE